MKPQVAFVGTLEGITLCECGQEMKEFLGKYECRNQKCERAKGKWYTAIIQSAVLFYKVKT